MSSASGAIATSVFERIAALDGTNYRSWAFSMKMLLKAHELWEVIEDEESAEMTEGEASAASKVKGKTRKLDAEWHKKDQLALSCIALALKPSEQEHIYNCVTAKEAWNCLKGIYEGKGTHRFLSLLKSICTVKLEDTKMKDYIRGVRQTADQLLEMDFKLEKPVIIGFILNGLPDGYRYLVVNLESQVKTISYEDLSARLIDEEKRVKSSRKEIGKSQERLMEIENSDTDTVTAHVSRTQKVVRCFRCHKVGHIATDCRRGDIFCEYCGRNGHEESECRVKTYQKRKSNKETGAHMAEAVSPTYSAIFGG